MASANNMRDEFLSRIDASEIRGHNFDDRDIEIYLNTGMDDEVTDMFFPDKNQRRIGFSPDQYRQLQLTGLISKRKAYKKSAGDFMVGTEDNGALPTPHDTDETGIGDVSYGVFVSIPNECLFPILLRANVYDGCLRKNVRVMMVDEYYYNEYINNGQRQPYKSLVWCLEYGNYTNTALDEVSVKGMSGTDTEVGDPKSIVSTTNRVHLLIQGKDAVIEQYDLRYVKRPRRIRIDIEAPAQQVSCELNEAIHKNVVERAVKIALASLLPKESKYNLAQGESADNA